MGKKMNKMKKALLGTALAGTLVVGAGYGTYSWFTAESTVSGDIQNYTLSLSPSSVHLFDANEKLAPSRTISDEFTITNSGELDQFLRGQFSLNADKAVDPSKYEVKVTAWHGEDKVGSIAGTGAEALKFDNMWYDARDHFTFGSGDKLKIKVDVTLKESAGNEYQGVTVGGEATIQGSQTDTGAAFEQPKAE
jgi:spore coat-associated protein N